MTISVYPPNKEIEFSDSTNIDAFGRLRVSEPFGLFDYKQIATKHSTLFHEVTAGSGSIAFQYDRSSCYLQTTTASGDRALRQSTRYFDYISGRSQLVSLTGVFGAGQTNVNQYIGYGDDLNGLFFKLQATTLGVVVRTATSGSAVDTFTAQSSWNIDKMDGTGPSGITLDITKAQIFVIDFQWLAVGRIRFCFDIDGVIYPVHEVLNANSIGLAYMKTPTLPVRYEVINTGTAASSTTLEQICAAVSSEGGALIPGTSFTRGNGTTTRAVTTRAPVFAIRLKSAFPSGEPNRRTIRHLAMKCAAFTNDAYFELAHMHLPSAITATWTSVGTDSAVEYSTDITAVTGNPEHVIDDVIAVSGVGPTAASAESELRFVDQFSYLSQNFDSTNSQMFVVYATSFSGTANVTTSLTAGEFE